MKFLRKYKITLLILILIATGVTYFLTRDVVLVFDTQIVEKSSLRQIVSETGAVYPANDATLSFAISGRIKQIFVEKGDSVEAGQTIAVLDTSVLNAQVRQFKASLDILLNEKDIERLEISFDGIKKNLANFLEDLYISSEDAIKNKADQPFTDGGSINPELIISSDDNYFDRKEINEQRKDIYYLFIDWQKSLEDISSESDFTPHIEIANENLLILRDYLTDLATLVNKFKPDGSRLTSADIDSYQTAVSVARSTINTSIDTLLSIVEEYDTEKVSVDSVGTDGEVKRLREIKIKEAQSKIDSIYAQISDAKITSPISGIVSDIFFENSESVNATSPVATVISDSDFEIKVLISEDDIENIDIGDEAEITFDAYYGTVFGAKVSFVSPSANIVDGIPVFEVTLNFDDLNDRILPGLSVDVDIVAKQLDNVTTLSRRAVVERDGRRFVRVLVDENTYIEKEVVLGLRGEDGMTEVISGVDSGDEVIIFIEDDVLEKLNKK